MRTDKEPPASWRIMPRDEDRRKVLGVPDSKTNHPAHQVINDHEHDKAPDPRRHYDSPEDLREDILLPLDERERLLREWRHDLDRRIESESEGMSADNPMSLEQESRLAAEALRVSKALEDVAQDRRDAEALNRPA